MGQRTKSLLFRTQTFLLTKTAQNSEIQIQKRWHYLPTSRPHARRLCHIWRNPLKRGGKGQTLRLQSSVQTQNQHKDGSLTHHTNGTLLTLSLYNFYVRQAHSVSLASLGIRDPLLLPSNTVLPKSSIFQSSSPLGGGRKSDNVKTPSARKIKYSVILDLNINWIHGSSKYVLVLISLSTAKKSTDYHKQYETNVTSNRKWTD